MNSYRETLRQAIFEATGERDVMSIPFSRFENREKIKFDNVVGSVNLINGRIQTEEEAACFVESVSRLKMP
jgi:hypothetical protein